MGVDRRPLLVVEVLLVDAVQSRREGGCYGTGDGARDGFDVLREVFVGGSRGWEGGAEPELGEGCWRDGRCEGDEFQEMHVCVVRSIEKPNLAFDVILFGL